MDLTPELTMLLSDKHPVKVNDPRKDVVRAVQLALIAAGAEMYPDGGFGPITETAVKRFQAANGFVTTGIVGPRTAVALDKVAAGQLAPLKPPAESAFKVAPWLSTMRALNGTKEIPGAMSNKLILGWRDEIIRRYPDLKPNLSWYVNDDTPWCGLATAYCVAVAGYKPPKAPLRARAWYDEWADGQRMDRPVLGCVAVFSRTGGGHVAFFENQDASTVHVRGGNQSNSVNLTKVAKNRLLGYMWPKGAPMPGEGAKGESAAGPVSKNEA